MAILINTNRTARGGSVTPGKYRVVVERIEERAGTNAPYINVTMRVLVPEEFADALIYATLPMTDRARWKLEQFLDAVGAPEAANYDLEEVIGTTLTVVVAEQKYHGADGMLKNGLTVTKFLTDDDSEANALPF